MATITNPSNLPAPVQNHFDYTLLSVPVPHMIYNTVAERKSMRSKSGRFLTMRRYHPLDVDQAKVPLGDSGQEPPPQALSAVDIQAEIEFYGTWIAIHEQVTLQNQDPKEYGVDKPSLIDLEAYGVS